MPVSIAKRLDGSVKSAPKGSPSFRNGRSKLTLPLRVRGLIQGTDCVVTRSGPPTPLASAS
jgi:hypothetical protein